MDKSRPPQRFLRFGIRDLLWAMVVVGLAIAWWSEARSNWPTAHPRWRAFCEDGEMKRKPKSIAVEYENGESTLTGWSEGSVSVSCGAEDM